MVRLVGSAAVPVGLVQVELVPVELVPVVR
jgi:hypothetical protein